MKTIFCIPVLVFMFCVSVHAQDAAAPSSDQTATQSAAAPVPAEIQAAAPAAAPAEPAPAVMGEKRELILKFIDVFGTRRAMEQNLETMFKDMGPNDPQTQKFKDNVRVDEIIEQLIPLYDKHFSADELKACITFYSSPEGQKLLQTIPVLMQESVDISAKYFEQKFPAVPPAPADTRKNVTQ